jgi:hypothetical protein
VARFRVQGSGFRVQKIFAPFVLVVVLVLGANQIEDENENENEDENENDSDLHSPAYAKATARQANH